MKTISVYEDAVPDFAAAAMHTLYRSIFSSPVFHRIYGRKSGKVLTYVARENDEVRSALLFEAHGRRLRVLNETVVLDADEIESFARWAFSHFSQARSISFKAVHLSAGEFRLPFLRNRFSEDIVIALPGSVEAYFASLGQSTRKNIKRYLNKLNRDHACFRHTVLIDGEIRADHVHAIARLNHLRMAQKGKHSDYDEQECDRLARLVRESGMVSLVEVNGEIVAGEVCSRVERDCFCHVGAHDPRFDEYRLGLLSCYLAVCEAIRRGGREFHLLWGQYRYKASLLGEQRDLDYLTLYRSRTDLYLNGGIMLRRSLDVHVRDLKTRVRDAISQQPAGAATLRRARQLAGQWRG